MDFDTSDSDEDVGLEPMQSRNARGPQRGVASNSGSSSKSSAKTSTSVGLGAGFMPILGTRPAVVRLEDEPRVVLASKTDYTEEAKEWKRQGSSMDERKSILTKLLSRQKSIHVKRGSGGTRVGLDVDDDSDDENKPQKSNFASREKLRNYLLEMRTGMPPRDIDSALSPHGRQQHVQQYDMELMKRMDAEAFADISSIVSRQCANILSCPDMVTVKRVCAHAQADLTVYGISQLQLWTAGVENKDTLESTGIDSATKVVLRLPHVTKALQIAEDEGKLSRGGGSGGLADVGLKVATIRPDDFSWDELERAMRLVGGETGSVSHNASKKWYAIHIVSPSPELYSSTGLPGSPELTRQVLLMSESVVSTNTVAISNRMAHSSPYKVKSLFMQECLRKLLTTLSLRAAQLYQEEQHGLHMRSITELERMAAITKMKEAVKDELASAVDANQVARVLSRALGPLYNGEGHGQYGSASGQLSSPASFKVWVLNSQLVGEDASTGENDVSGGAATMTAHIGHMKGNFIAVKEISRNTALGRLFPKSSGMDGEECTVGSLQEADLVSVGLVPGTDSATGSDTEEAKDLPTWGTSRDLFIITRAVSTGATSSPSTSSDRLIILVACPLLSSRTHQQQQDVGDSGELEVAPILDQEALVKHVDEMAGLASTALQKLYSARLSDIETALRQLPSTLACLEFNMGLESGSTPLPGYTFRGALQDFASALQGSPPDASSIYSPSAPLSIPGNDLQSAFAAHRLRFLASDQFLSSLHLCADDVDETLSFFDVSMTRIKDMNKSRSPHYTRSGHLWLQELLEGRWQHYTSARYLTEDAVTDSDLVRGSLESLVRFYEPSAASCFVLPLRTAHGLCLMLAVEADIVNSAVVKATDMNPQDIGLAYTATNICGSLSRALATAHAVHTGQIAVIDRARLNRHKYSLAMATDKLRTKEVVKQCFLHWKVRKLTHDNKVSRELLAAGMEILSLPMKKHFHEYEDGVNGDSDDEEDDLRLDDDGSPKGVFRPAVHDESSVAHLFMSRVEDQTVNLFHNHVVHTYLGDEQVPDALLDNEDNYVARTSTDERHNPRSVLIGVIRCEDEIIGCVRVVKTSSVHAYGTGEVAKLSHFCEVASTAYTAMSVGLTAPQTRGNVNAILLPLLLRAMPALFSPRGGADKTQALLEMLSVLFKHLCGGDVAVLRLTKSPFPHLYEDLGGGFTHATAASGEVDSTLFAGQREVHVSSEDTTHHASMFGPGSLDFPALFNNFPDLSGLVDLSVSVNDEDQGVATRTGGDEEAARFSRIVLQLRDPATSADLGEVKVIGPAHQDGFTMKQVHAARLLAYVTSSLVRYSSAHDTLRETGTNVQEMASQLRSLADSTKRDVHIEQRAVEAFKARLSSALALTVFLSRLHSVDSIAQLSSFVHESLPTVLGVDSATLLLSRRYLSPLLLADVGNESAQSAAGAGDAALSEDGLRFTSAREGANYVGAASEKGNTGDDNTFVSFRRLSTIPVFGNDPRDDAKQAKLLLHSLDADEEASDMTVDSGATARKQEDGGKLSLPFGAIITHGSTRISTSSSSPPAGETLTGVPGDRPWSGLEDVLLKGLGENIHAVLKSLRRKEKASMLAREKELHRSKHNGAMATVSQLEEQLGHESALKREYEATNDALQTRLEGAQQEIERYEMTVSEHLDTRKELESDRDAQYERFHEKIALSEAASLLHKEAHEKASLHGSQLQQLIESFSYDQRCHRETVVHWLDEFAAANNALVITVMQHADGTLAGGEDVRGSLSAAGEALRTGITQEILTYYSPGSGTTIDDGGSAGAVKRRQTWIGMRLDGDRACVLVVPNRCIDLHTKHENACYLVIKAAKDKTDHFDDCTKSLVKSAVNLTARALLRASSKFSFDEMRQMELALQSEKASLAKIRHALLLGDRLHRKQCSTLAEFAREMETLSKGLLMRGDHDHCIIQSFLWFIPVELSSSISSATLDADALMQAMHSNSQVHVTGDVEAVKHVLTSEPPKPYKRAGMLWCPLVNKEGQVYALLRVERKLAMDIPMRSDVATGSSHMQIAPGSGLAVGDLLITKEEEDAVHALCRQATSQHERIVSLLDAMQSIDTAGTAISSLRGSQAELEQKLTEEGYGKRKVEEALKAGSDLMSAACAKRVSADMLMDAARKAINSITGCDDCYIVLPGIEDVFPSPNFSGKLLAIGAAGVISNSDKVSNSEVDMKYYTVESDQHAPVQVILQLSDLEMAAMQTMRPLSVGAGTTASSKGDQDPTIPKSAAFGSGHSSTSWAIRRLFSRTTVRHGHGHTHTKESDPDAVSKEVERGAMDDYHATAIPFPLLNGQHAVVTCVKKDVALPHVDRDCVAWLSKVFTYCLDMWVGKGSINEALSRIDTMQGEIERLQDIQREATMAEAHASALRRDLCTEVGVANVAKDSSDFPVPSPQSPSRAHARNTRPNRVTSTGSDNPDEVNDDQVVLPIPPVENMDDTLSSYPARAPALVPPSPPATVRATSESYDLSSPVVGHEVEGEAVVLATIEQVFVGLSARSMTASAAGVSIGNMLPIEAGLAGTTPSNEIRNKIGDGDSNLHTSSHGSAFRGVVSIPTAKCSYWVGRTATSVASAPPADDESKEVVIYIYLAHAQYPAMWVGITGLEHPAGGSHSASAGSNAVIGNVSLRLAMLLKLLEAQAGWRGRLGMAENEIGRLRELCRGLLQENTTLGASHLTAVQKMKADHNHTFAHHEAQAFKAQNSLAACLHAGQDFYERAVELANRVTVLTEEVEGVGTVQLEQVAPAITSSSPWLVESFARLCKHMSSAMGWGLYHGKVNIPSSQAYNTSEVVGLSLVFEESGLSWSFSRREVEAMHMKKWAKQEQEEEEEDVHETELADSRRLDRLTGKTLADDGNTTVAAHQQRKNERDARVASSAVVVMVVGKEDESVQKSVAVAKDTLASSYYRDLQPSDIHGTSAGHTPSRTEQPTMHKERVPQDNVEFILLPLFSAVYRTGTVLLPLHGRVLVIRPPVSDEEGRDEVDAINNQASSATDGSEAPASLAAVLVSCIGISRAVRDGIATFSDLVAIHRVSIEQRDALAVTKADLWDRSGALESTTRRNLELEQRLSKYRERVATLSHQSIQNLRYEHTLANLSELLRGFNKASTNLSSGALGLWSQSSKVLMSLMASHVTLRGCGLCLVDPDRFDRDRGDDPSSAPILEYCCRGYDGNEILSLADDFEVESNVFSRDGEELEPAVLRQVQGLLLEDKAYQAKGRVVYCLSAGSHIQHHRSSASSSADMVGSREDGGSSGAKDGDSVEEQVWLVPVKTSRHIHAVLHIRVSIHKEGPRGTNIGKDVLQEDMVDDEENGEDEDDRVSRPSAVPPPSPANLPHHVLHGADTPDNHGSKTKHHRHSGQMRIRFTPDTKLAPRKTDAVTPRSLGAVSSDQRGTDISSGSNQYVTADGSTDDITGIQRFAGTPGSAISGISAASGAAYSTSHSHHGKALLTDSEEAVDAAQTSALNFAEVLAPLLLAASTLDDTRRANDATEKALQRTRELEDTASTALSISKRSQDLLRGTINATNAFESSLTISQSTEVSVSSDAIVSEKRRVVVSGKSRLPLQSLVDDLCSVLDGSVNILLDESRTLKITEGDSAFSASSLSGSLVSTELRTSDDTRLGKVNVTVYEDSASGHSRGKNHTNTKVAAVQAAIEDIGAAISGVVTTTANMRLVAQTQVQMTVDMHQTKSRLDEAELRLRDTSTNEKQAQMLSKHYKGLTSLSRQVFGHMSALANSPHMVSFGALTADGITTSPPPKVELSQVLPLLCSRMASLFVLDEERDTARDRASRSSESLSFGVCIGQEMVMLDSTTATVTKSLRQLQWYHAPTNVDNATAAPFDGGSAASEGTSVSGSINDTETRDIADNLARSCIHSGHKTVVDIGGNNYTATNVGSSDGGYDEREGAGGGGVRVLCFPLLANDDTYGSSNTDPACIGVLQLIVKRSLVSSGKCDAGVEGGLVDEFCSTNAAAIATLVHNHAHNSNLSTTLTSHSDQLENARNKSHEMEAFMNMWQSRADAWGGVAAAASALLRHSTAGAVSILDVLSSEAVAAPLRGTGIHLRIIKANSSTVPAESVSEDKTRSKSTRTFHAASDFVSIDEEANVSVEVSCAGSDTSGPINDNTTGKDVATFLSHEANVAPIATELVGALSTVIKSTVSMHRARTMQVGHIEEQHNRLSNLLTDKEQELDSTRRSIALLEQDLHTKQLELQECEKLTNIASTSMASFCGPTIREVAVMLEELGTERRPQVLSTKDAARTSVLDWAWEGVARVADRAMSRMSNGEFGFHTSILVQVPASTTAGLASSRNKESALQSDLYVKCFDMGRRQETLTIASTRGPKAAKLGILSDPNASTLEKALLAGGVHENRNSLSHVDMIGIEKQVLSAIFDSSHHQSKVTVICIALPDAPAGVNAVLRVVFPSEPVSAALAATHAAAEHGDAVAANIETASALVGPRHLAKHVLEMTMSLGCAVIHICHHLSTQDQAVSRATTQAKAAIADKENIEEQLALAKKIHRVVCREACSLLDPPLVGPGGQAPRAVHPASLTPLAASQDSCMKVLAMARTLLRGEGQALLLRDTTTDPVSYQVIYSGNILSYSGLDQGSFGTVSAGDNDVSLAVAAMHTHKAIIVDDAAEDTRYNGKVDGNVTAYTPMMFIPIRGRGSSVIGALISARGKDGELFTAEDLAAGEIAVSHGALSLYWCQGLGALHHTLNKTVNRLQDLESAVMGLRRNR